MENANHTYDVFISYSRSDYVKDDPDNLIVNILKLFDENKVRYFFDQNVVVAGDEYAAIITNAIIESETFLFISTESANSSIWTSKEIALAHHYKKKIIPVRADMSFYNSSIVFYLADIDYIDGTDKTKVIERLSKSIVAPIKERIALREKEENEKKQEQERLISSIKLDIAQVESDQKSIEITREKIKLQICEIESKETRDELSSLLDATSPANNSLEEKLKELEAIFMEMEKEKLRREHEHEHEHKHEPAPQPKKRFSLCREHSIATNILFFIAALSLIVAPIYLFADTGKIALSWRWSLEACSLAAFAVLVLMFCRRRISIIVHIAMIAAFAALTYFENIHALQFGEEWPTTFLAGENQRYIPISLVMAAVYILGFIPFLIKKKKN